ncbi:MFS transporter [Castellaniella sp. WN]
MDRAEPLRGFDVGSQAATLNSGVRKAVGAATVGTLIEWYDYALYGAAAGLIINKLFFPNLSEASGILAAFATFAVGFVARPLGGVLISHIGDKFGRRPALILTIMLMGGATVAMGLLPTFAQIGIWAAVLLVLFRLIQGFGAGAELAGAVVLVAEYAPPRRRGFYTAIVNAAPGGGILLATLSFLAISALPEDVLLGWAWRVPFLLSGLLFAVALYIRKRLDETPEYTAAVEKANAQSMQQHTPLKELFAKGRKELICGFLSVTGHNANAYILAAFALSYLINTVGMSRSESLLAVTISTMVAIVSVPLMGALSDRIGHAKVFSLGALFAILFAFPFFWMLDTGNLAIATLAMSLLYGIGYGAMAGAQGVFLSELFETRYRFSGLALARELNGALVAGPTPFIAAALVNIAGGKPSLVACYLMFCCVLTIVGVTIAKRASRTRIRW